VTLKICLFPECSIQVISITEPFKDTSTGRRREAIIESLAESSIIQRKSFIRSFVREIKVTGDEVLLTYTMPLPTEGTLEEKMPVLYSVPPSGDRPS
jgi:hypothetical protein